MLGGFLVGEYIVGLGDDLDSRRSASIPLDEQHLFYTIRITVSFRLR